MPYDDEAQDNSEGSGEDLIGDAMIDDYRVMGVLDQYDSQMLDDNDYVDDPDARARAEAAIQARERRQGKTRRGMIPGRLGAALESDEGGERSGGERRGAVGMLSDSDWARSVPLNPPLSISLHPLPPTCSLLLLSHLTRIPLHPRQ